MMKWIKEHVGTVAAWLGSVLHNCIAHPLMPFLPRSWGERLHAWTLTLWPPTHDE